jgi:hypothetical protein
MARGGARLNAGRRSSWTSGCGFDDTTTIRIPKYLKEEVLEIAHDLDEEFYLTKKMPTDNPKISCYVPQEIYDKFSQFKEERRYPSTSQAMIAILTEFFDIHHEEDGVNLKDLIQRLSDRVARLESNSTGEPLSDDLLYIESGAIGHQVNCQGVMNAGLVKKIRERYPIVFEKYKELVTAHAVRDEKKALLGVVQPVRVSESLIVYNLFGQFSYGRQEVHTDYDALTTIACKLRDRGVQIHLPKRMGCGLGGGDWTRVQDIFSIADVIWVGKEG